MKALRFRVAGLGVTPILWAFQYTSPSLSQASPEQAAIHDPPTSLRQLLQNALELVLEAPFFETPKT